MSILPFPVIALALGMALPQPAGWEVGSTKPGGPPCRAMKRGASLDIQILRNRAGNMIIVPGLPSWDHSGGEVALTVAVDDGPPATVSGFPIGPSVFVLVEDRKLAEQIKAAHSLTWKFPWGSFTAEVDGLGKTFDALAVCPE